MALTDDLVAFYDADENSSADLLDDSGANLHLDVDGTVIPRVSDGPGDTPYSRDLENSDGDHWQGGDQGWFKYTDVPFTFACWAKLESQNADRYLLMRVDTTDWVNRYSYLLHYQNSSDRWRWHTQGGDGSYYDIGSTETVTTGWHFIACGYVPGASPYVWIKVDEETTQSLAAAETMASDTAVFFRIGRTQNGIGAVNYDGTFCKFGAWQRKLTEAELTTLYDEGNGLNYSGVTLADAPAASVVGVDGSLLSGGGSKIFLPPFHPLP